MRVLGRVRLSRSTEESTSIERQREIITQWTTTNGHTLVGFATDVDVSGSTDPFETPEFGVWLSKRAPEWDIVAAWRLDRLGRDAIRLNKLFGWCIDHGKSVVSCTEAIDLSTPVGRLIANVIGFLAEGELQAIKERQQASRAKLRNLGRWPGGKPPFGYTARKTKDGWTLDIDPVASEVVARIVNDVIDGKPIARVAAELTSEGVDTPAGYYARLRGSHAPETASWQATAIRNMLRSKALRGYAHHKNETVRDDDGRPIQIAEPLVTLDEWDLLQAALDQVQARGRGRPPESGPLSGVAFCLGCEGPLHYDRTTSKGHLYLYYRCVNRDSAMIRADWLEELAEQSFLEQLGDHEVRERVWVTGDAHEADLREAVTALDELSEAAGRAVSATAKRRLQRQLDTLDARIAELESAPAREARWEYQPTGQTYRAVWESSDTDARRELLQRSGITIAARVGRRYDPDEGVFQAHLRVPAEVLSAMNR